MKIIKKIVENTYSAMVIKIMPLMVLIYLINEQKEFIYTTTLGGIVTYLLLFIIIFQIMLNDIYDIFNKK